MHYKLTIEYDGTRYCGMQRQFGIVQKSIEEVVEKAIFSLAQEEVRIISSGRTDAGVHALGQVVNFTLQKKFSEHTMVAGLNNYLREEDVAILSCELVDENFHARFLSKKRHYRYRIINRYPQLVLEKNRAWQVARDLDIKAMRQAAECLIGQHDFSSFRDSECQSSQPIKTLDKIEITQIGEEIRIDFSAKSFLHHMVRNIVGTLVYVGIGKIGAEEMKNILEAKDRTKSGPNAPACGLYFMGVDY
ncbi:MAG: tRNA pseudouridine(38-40) synthase TruA [Proteobacteria bacterium]|nr:tRNA pseudouridine(38-40) synthase TruA [Pseudomonadota bacterium]